MMRDSSDIRQGSQKASIARSHNIKEEDVRRVEVDYAGVPPNIKSSEGSHRILEEDVRRVEVDYAGVPHVEVEEEGYEEPDASISQSEHDGEEPPLRMKRLTPEEHRELRRRALPLHIAEERFHRVFPPWSAQRASEAASWSAQRANEEACRKVGDCDAQGEAARLRNASGASLGEMDPQRMQDMLAGFTHAIMNADPGSTGCLDIQLDLTTLGVPNVIVSVGVEGSLVRSARTNCVEWKFRTNLGFNYKFWILGADFFFRVSLETSVELLELHCTTKAKESFYCQYLKFVVQDFSESDKRKCHADSPFDIIMTYLKFQWQIIQNWVAKHIFRDKDSDYFGSPLEKDLRAIRNGLQKYPDLFKAAPVQAYPRLGSSASKPRKAKVHGRTKWLWVIENEIRLCWSSKEPKRPQETLRTDKRMLEMRQACQESVALSDITPFMDGITVQGKKVVLGMRGNHRDPVSIEFDSSYIAATWRRDFLSVMTEEWGKERRLLSSKCVSASLNEKHDPYCILDMPGELWGSEFHHNTRSPNWEGDGIGFHVESEGRNYRGQVIASVRDMDTNWLEKFWEWLWNNGNDPLQDYIGEARVSVCTDNQAPRWVKTSDLSKCTETDRVESKEANADECKKTCLRLPGCAAIEFLHDGKCFFFRSSCGASLEEQGVAPGVVADGSLFDDDPESVQEDEFQEEFMEDAMRKGGTLEQTLQKKDGRRRRRRAPPPTQPFKLVERGCDIQASVTQPREITMPLMAIDKKSSGFLWWKKTWRELKRTGNVKLKFQWGDAPEPSNAWSYGLRGDGIKGFQSYPGLVNVAQAMFAALDQYLGKIPDYCNQVLRRLKPYDPKHKQFEDGGLDYAAFDGRFGARWNPRTEGDDDKEEEETYDCPPPDDAGARHELHCEMNGMHDKKGSWWNKLFNRLQDMFTNPPCEGQLHEHDDRVVHFARGIRDSKFSQQHATRVRFHAELTISMLNLFVRMVGDVQALFNVYFADEPAWDGNCYGLPSEFMLPYEFGVDMSDGKGYNWDPHSKDFSQTAVPERRADGLVSEESGKKMPNDKNPFCKWTWSSSRKRQKHRVDFARQDAPINGRDGYVTPPRDASAHMRPHIWCRVARAYREKQGDDAPFNVNNPNKSRTNLRFRNACQQVRLSDYGAKNWTAETKRRYECEDTILSPSFVTLFPKFLKKILGSTSPLMQRGDAGLDVGWFGEIGTIAEDVLQCAGYITAEMRQFETTLQIRDVDINDICNGGKEHLDSITSTSGSRYNRIEDLVPQWSQKVLAKLGEFTSWLKGGGVTDDMAVEFRDAFAYFDLNDHRGTMFTGKAWRAGLTVARDEMGTAAAIETRIQESMDLAVEEAFKDKGGDAAGLFTLPVQISITYSLSMGFAFELSNLCNLGVSAQLRFNIRVYINGWTWNPYLVGGNTKLCFSGVFAPIHMFYLLIDTEFCITWTRNGDMEYSWHIRVKSVIFEKNALNDVFNSTVGKLYKKMTGRTPLKSDMTTGDLNNIIENAAWQLSRKLLLDPELINDVVGIVASATIDTIWDTAKKLCDKIAHHVQDKIVPMAKDIYNMALSNALQMAVKYVIDALTEAFDLVHKNMGIVTVGVLLHTQKAKGEKTDEWSKSAMVDFQRVKRTTIGIPELPMIGQLGTAGLGFTFKFDTSFRYDFSDAFNTIMAGWGVVGTLFDCCTACLDDLGNAFCESHKGSPKCFPWYGDNEKHPVPCDDKAHPMIRYMDCSALGEKGKAAIDKSVTKDCKYVDPDDFLLRRSAVV